MLGISGHELEGQMKGISLNNSAKWGEFFS